jgi:galactose mutarotase-like enzyme
VGDPAADGYDTVVIESPGSELRAAFVPRAGMVCCSLRHCGVELLAQRSGVRAYAQRGSTMGIPLLYPWANRLCGPRYSSPRGEVTLDLDDALLKLDENGLPIHGVIAGALPWELLDGPAGAGDQLHARLSWRSPKLLAVFPFPHAVELHAHIEGEGTLVIETSVHADDPVASSVSSSPPSVGPLPVPVSFGYHPYLTLPGDRAGWKVELPVNERLPLDARMIPTGAREPVARRCFQLDGGSWDDAYSDLRDPPTFRVSSPGAGISLELRRGYTHAQLYAPAGGDFVCFEPMTAPTNALVSHEGLRLIEPGEAFHAAFAISVQAAAPEQD